MRVSLRARQTAAVTILIALAMTALSVQYLANLARVGLEDSRGIGDLIGRMIYNRAREAIAAGGDPESALRTDQGIRSILQSTAAYGRNVIERAVILSPGEFVEADCLPNDLSGAPPPSIHSVGLTPGMTVDEAERRLIELTLEHTRDNKTRAAEILGVTVKTLHNKLKRFRREAEKS